MRFSILGSGSSGNSAIVVSDGSRILLDAGFSARRLGALLKDEDQRAALVEAGRETVKSLGGALDRTLAALDPYLVDLRMDRPPSHA